MEAVIHIVVTLFIVLDPFGNLAVFHTVLSSCPEKNRRRILIREVLIALFVLMLFLFCGQAILDFLGLKTSTLHITSGVILFIISIGMIFPAKSVLGSDPEDEPFIVPLAIPLIAGPSTLILLLLLASQHGDNIWLVALATFIAWALSSLVLLASPICMKFLGKKGTQALERLMGMILVMIAIQMFFDGIAVYAHIAP